MVKKYKLLGICMFCLLLASCAQNQAQGGDGNYEETKKMIVDILKTDDGKKALNDILADDQFKQQIVIEQKTVKEAIQQALVSEQGKDFWKKQMEDPKFAESMAKSIQKQHEDLLKKMLNDPEYQKKLMEIMQDPEMEKHYLALMKGNEFRSQIQELIGEAFENPLFRAEIADMLKQVTDEELKAKKPEGEGDKKKGKNEEQGGGEGGNEGGGGQS